MAPAAREDDGPPGLSTAFAFPLRTGVLSRGSNAHEPRECGTTQSTRMAIVVHLACGRPVHGLLRVLRVAVDEGCMTLGTNLRMTGRYPL